MTHLHTHSHLGSRLDALASPEDYAHRAFELGHKGLAITDHGRLTAIWENQQACKKYGIKPIIGIEMYLNNELEKVEIDTEKRIRTRNSHIILLAKNKEGYRNLLYLNYLSMKDDIHFYYNPRISEAELFNHKEGLIVGTACITNPIISLLREGKSEDAEKTFLHYLYTFESDFYVEIQLNELSHGIDKLQHGQKTANEFLIQMAQKYGVPIVITGDVHYLEKGQDKLQTLAIAIRDKATIDNLTFEFESKELYYHDLKDYIEFNERFGYNYNKDDIVSWVNNSDYIASKISFEIPRREKLFLPKMTDNDELTLIEKGKIGLMKRFGVSRYEEIPTEYRKRLEKELEIINRKGFASYFLIVDDIIQFSIKEDIYGRIGRGSVGGSLLAYGLEIHNLDPIKYGLLFERFLSESRSSDQVLDYFYEED